MRKLFGLLAIILVLASTFGGLFVALPAQAVGPPTAPTSGTWVDRTNINIGGVYFRPTRTVNYDDNPLYVPAANWSPQSDNGNPSANQSPGDKFCGVPYIDFRGSGQSFVNSGAKATYHNNYLAADKTCVAGPTSVIPLSNAGQRYVTAYKISDVNDDTHHAEIYLPIYKIGIDDGVKGAIFGTSPPEKTDVDGYFANRPKDSASGFDADDFPFYQNGTWTESTGSPSAWVTLSKKKLTTNGCHPVTGCGTSDYSLVLANNGKTTDPGTIDPIYKNVLTTAANNASGGSAGNELVCNIPYISWIVCPLIQIGYDVSGWLEKQVLDLLKAPDLSSTQNAWGQFRNLADALFILIFMVVLFGNSLSLGIDAYTIKKALPRLVAAAIFVQLSFFLCQIAIDISQVAGTGLYRIIANTLIQGNTNNTGYQIAGIAEILGVGALGLAGLLAAPEIAVGLVLMVLLLIFSFMIAIFGVYFTLTFRIIVLQILVMASPLAFVAWILPNTEKFFKMWWTNFSKTLMMYPMIAVLFATGDFVNKIGNTTNSNFSSHLSASIAPIVVMFVIPMTFKLSGTALGAISGAVTSRANKASRGVRQGQLAKNTREGLKETAALHGLGSDKKGVRGFLARGTGRLLTGNAASFGTVGRRKMASTIAAAGLAERNDNTQVLKRIAPDNPSKAALWNKGEINGKKLSPQMRQALLENLMANKGAPEYAKIFVDLENSDGKFDPAIAAGKWGMSETDANLVWKGAHEGANGSWAVQNGFRPDGYKGVDNADVVTFSKYRPERIDNFTDRHLATGNLKDVQSVASMFSAVANSYEARDGIARPSMVHLKNKVTLGHPEYNPVLASQVINVGGVGMTMEDLGNKIDSDGQLNVT